MTLIRVLLADDHTLVRAGFRAILEALPDVHVVAEAGDGREALRLIEQHQPNVALMDIAMPGLNGLEAAGRVSEAYPHVRVIILSMHANEEYVIRALQSGAVGYLLKDASPGELDTALHVAAQGRFAEQRASGNLKRKHVGQLDAMAAQIVLENWLQSLSPAGD